MTAQLRRLTLIAALLEAIMPAAALAEEFDGGQVRVADDSGGLRWRRDESFLAGGGAASAFDGSIQDRVDTGAAWERLGLRSRTLVEGEAHDRLHFQARRRYREAFYEDLIRSAGGTLARLNNWAATASLGYDF
jgi:hypothetical protein